MEYPIWWIPSLSGGLLIACMAIFHVFIAHFAVGSGLFLVLTERKGFKENNPEIVNYVKRHTRFFVLLTMVAGGVTGVGIWFTISLLSPSATSTLVHNFGFGWAAEWVFFLCEIVALLLYHYKFTTMSRQDHMKLGWLYFIFAYGSLFVINGIITMMLTPGDWLETQAFWDGFFNPTFWPSLAIRSAMSFMFSGLFALVTALGIQEKNTRETMLRWAAAWIGIPFFLLCLSGWWYLGSLPAAQYNMIVAKSAQTPALLQRFIPIAAALVLAGLAVAYWLPHMVRKPVVAVMLVLGICQIGTFEWIREAGRRPYLIHGHTWSSSIRVSETERIMQEGALISARWTTIKTITQENTIDAGRELYKLQCLACHSIEGPMLAAEKKSALLTERGMRAQLSGQGKLRPYMPPFLGTEQERMALAAFIAKTLHDRQPHGPQYTPQEVATIIPGFEQHEAEYLLAAWATSGMTTIADAFDSFAMQAPGADIRAQLILRGDIPEIITENVTLEFSIEPNFSDPASQVNFWKYAAKQFDREIPPNYGRTGNSLHGTMKLEEENRAFIASQLPAMPYGKDGAVNPYPVVNVVAKATDGKILAATRVALPVSTEWGCRKCHDGNWRVNNATGMSGKTAENILSVHDKINKTALVKQATGGNPALCQNCHSSPKFEQGGIADLVSFSAAIHGWHANYLTNDSDKACTTCHPGSQDSITQQLRGLHASRGMTCVNCHGTLEDHALGLLKKEQEQGKNVTKLMQHLVPRVAESLDAVQARAGYLSEPDCNVCHDYFTPPPADASAAHQWTSGEPSELFRNRHDDMGAIMCQACHGTTHALYPAENVYGVKRNNIVPMQYINLPGPLGSRNNCVCHTIDLPMEASAHHPIMPDE